MPQHQLNPTLTKYFPDGLEEEYTKRFIENEDLFNIVLKVITEKLEANSARRRAKSAYDKPEWSGFQADCNGVERSLTEFQSILKITKEN